MSETDIERQRCLAIVRLQMSDRLPIESRRLLSHIGSMISNGHKPQQESNPRKNAEDAYFEYMSITDEEFNSVLESLMNGGILEVQENIGFQRAMKDRPRP